MNPHGQKLLELLFDPEEEACVSPDGFGYHSIPVKDLHLGSFILMPQTDKQQPRACNPNDITLVAMNPIKGPRKDENVTALRTFMVELDEGNLAEQFQYVKEMKLPYSICVFSGGKSLHYSVTLTKPLPSEEVWRFYAEWILAVMSRADQQTKNPSRGIRFAGNFRDGNEMKLIDYKGRIELEVLQNWLAPYRGFMPMPKEKPVRITSEMPSLLDLPDWVINELETGIDTTKGRNNRWFVIACQCGNAGWDEDMAINILGYYFQEDRDFARKEWEIAIKSGIVKSRGNL